MKCESEKLTAKLTAIAATLAAHAGTCASSTKHQTVAVLARNPATCDSANAK